MPYYNTGISKKQDEINRNFHLSIIGKPFENPSDCVFPILLLPCPEKVLCMRRLFSNSFLTSIYLKLAMRFIKTKNRRILKILRFFNKTNYEPRIKPASQRSTLSQVMPSPASPNSILICVAPVGISTRICSYCPRPSVAVVYIN